ncbi:MAG: inositol monophosphatase [Butyricicoccus pullicaecorum]|nr:inositol monophosphatase [Butyricicoccus pullicaecorum]
MLTKIEAAAKQAGQILLSAQNIRSSVSQKEGIGNFVTHYDIQVQQFLRETLLNILPDAHFVGEEDSVHEDALDKLAFIVDPIDCTANFVRSMNHSAVSIALAQDGELICGVVYNPYRDELFSAQKNHGAFLNHQPITVSSRSLSDGIFCFGTSPYDLSQRARTFEIAGQLMNHMQDLRRFGSAALDLTDIACGRVELGFECILQPWDFAAGALILSEAGGIATQLNGEPLTLNRPCSILSGNKQAHAEFLSLQLDL